MARHLGRVASRAMGKSSHPRAMPWRLGESRRLAAAISSRASLSRGAQAVNQRAVWRPLATKMELVTSRPRGAMGQQPDGWWNVDLEPELSQADYAYSIDGSRPVPDPRSPWQPDGVHRCSRPLDHSSFEWSDAGWRQQPLSAAVIYECHIGNFKPGGTLDSVIESLG